MIEPIFIYAILFIAQLFYLLVGHALADFSLQTHVMAQEKSRHSESDLQKFVPWYYWLSAHALIHGGVVGFLTMNPFLGILETIAHWIIDFGKCEGWYKIHVDQLLHFICKILWVLLWL